MTGSDDKKTILLVDGGPVNIEVAREIFENDYKTRNATSGAKALESVKVPPGTGPDPARRPNARKWMDMRFAGD